jgi:hypothetical protein
MLEYRLINFAIQAELLFGLRGGFHPVAQVASFLLDAVTNMGQYFLFHRCLGFLLDKANSKIEQYFYIFYSKWGRFARL